MKKRKLLFVRGANQLEITVTRAEAGRRIGVSGLENSEWMGRPPKARTVPSEEHLAQIPKAA